MPSKKKVVINIAQEVDFLGSEPPLFNDGTTVRPMTVGDLIVSRIPGAASRDRDFAVRLWTIGGEITKAQSKGQSDFEMSGLDFEFLRNTLTKAQKEVWVEINLDRAFAEAEERSKEK